MATEQVLQWMQSDLKLSQEIQNFEADFSSGYLFGEILCQYGICDNIRDFQRKETKEAKVNNFFKIEDALRKLKVRFDGKMIHNIMQEERGASLRLLFQIKLAVQKMMGPAPDQLENLSLTNLKQSTVDRVRQGRMEKTNALANTITARTVGGKDIRTQKQKRADAHVIKFEVAQKMLFDDAWDKGKAEADLLATLQQTKRDTNRRKLRENQEFMKEWEAEGKANWSQNQQTRAQNIARVQYFDDREVGLYKEKLNKELSGATEEMQVGFSEFDKNLQKLGIELNVNMEDAMKKMEEKKGIPPGQIQNFSYAATMNKIKETKKQSDFAGKERERRRRKLAVDQATTQSKLDKKRDEDQLVEKLLKLQKEEQRDAYIDIRTRKCKDLIAEERRLRAIDAQTKKEQKFLEIEQRRIAETKALEAQRQREIEVSKLEYKGIRKAEKAAKRSLNIEIASEVADLILDMAEEVYATSSKQRNNKLTKAQWREFTELFAQGKRCSLRNVKKNNISAPDESMNDNQGSLIVEKGLLPHEILIVYRNEPSLYDMYEFMSSSGIFNLANICNDTYFKVASEYKIQIDNSIDGSVINNPGIGEKLQSIQNDHQTQENVKEITREYSKLSKDFSFKLSILGRTYSGKKTIAKALQDKLGQQNIKIFNMDQIIAEALEYVTPKKAEDSIPDPKAKPSKKGKAEETGLADQFEGKDTKQYKEISKSIKDQYFQDFDGELDQKVDLASCVLDDVLTVQLFVERLKIEYEGVEVGLKQEEIEAGITRERELEAQLEEIQDSGAAQPETGGKKGKGAPKGGRTSDEAIKEELESIRSCKVNGWILVDFPRNLTQMKLLETALSGFELKAELPKDLERQKYEAWSRVAYPPRLIDPDFEFDNRPVQSGLDGVLILQTPFSECQRRATGRKIDPQTNTIYHPEDNPAPEDPKIQERLQDHFDEAGQPNRMEQTSTRFNNSINLIQQWTSKFGLVDESSGKCTAQLDMVISPEDPEQWKNKNTVLQLVDEKIQSIIDFRQVQFDKHRDSVRKEMAERVEREAKEREEEAAKTAAQEQNSLEESKEQAVIDGDKEPTVDAAGSQEDVKSERSKEKLTMQGINKQSGLLSIQSPKRGSEVPQSSMARSHMGRSSLGAYQRIVQISDAQKLQKMESMMCEYFGEGLQGFSSVRNLRQRVFRSLIQSQRQFVSYLERSSEMQKKLNEFCESYNRFSTEFPDLLANDETKDELMNRIQILSQQLWEVIKTRKSESMKERSKFMDGGWVQVEMANLTVGISKLIESEFTRFKTISSVVTGLVLNETAALGDMAKRLQERGIESYVPNQTDITAIGTSPVMKEITSLITGKMQNFMQEEFVLQADQEQWEMIQIEQKNFTIRLNSLLTWAMLLLHEIHQMSYQVYDVLDDWIVVAVKQENTAAQKAVQQISENVQNGVQHIDSVILQELDLASAIDFLEFQEGPPLYLQEAQPIYTIQSMRFKIEQLQSIYNQFRSLQEDTNLIDAETFLSLVQLNLQSGNLPSIWKYAQFEHIVALKNLMSAQPLTDCDMQAQKYGTRLFRRQSQSMDLSQERRFVNLRKAFLALALIGAPFPTNEQREEYFTELKKNGSLMSNADFIDTFAWFDVYEGAVLEVAGEVSPSNSGLNDSTDAEDALDEERMGQLKTLIFQAYKVPNREGMWTEEFITDIKDLFNGENIATSIKSNMINSESGKPLSEQAPSRCLYNTLLGI